MDEHNTYLQILINSLEKKVVILDQLIEITLEQEKSMESDDFDIAAFNDCLERKGNLIDQINQLDDGFESVYDRVKTALQCDKSKYQSEIIRMQELIGLLTEKSVKLQTMELRNKPRIEQYFKNKKNKIKNFKISNKTASSYYKNMANQHQGQSYFLDKKK